MVERRLRALVVDDEEMLRSLTVRALERQGFNCDVAGDGSIATEMLAVTSYDVVVTDLRMPNVHGHALCRDILGRGDRPRVVVLTGVLEPKLAADLTARGVDQIHFKPVNYQEFAAGIRDLLNPGNGLARATGPDGGMSGAAADALEADAPGEDRAAATSRRAEDGHGYSTAGSESAGPQTKHVVALLLRNPQRCQTLAAELSSTTVHPIAAASSESLHAALNRQRVDVVVIENDLGGFLSGLEILERLRSDLLRPEAILLSRLDERTSEQVKMLGVETVLNPQSEIEQISETVRGTLAVMKNRHEFIPPAARKLVHEYGEIPPLSQLVVKLLSYLEMDTQEIPIKELAREISIDPRSTSELLKLTNSSSTGLRRQITKVFDAVNLLGVKRTIALILSSATVGAQDKLLGGSAEFLRDWYHRRSVLIASAAGVFAQRMDDVSSDTAFVLGLLQDIGILILANSFPARYPQTIDRFRQVGQLQLPILERDDCKMTHAEVSAALLQHWGLPQSLIGLVLDHHRGSEAPDRSKTDRAFLRAMLIAESLANLSDLRHPSRRHLLNRLLKEYGENRGGECNACIKESVARAVEACELLSVPVPDSETLNTWLHALDLSDDVPAAAEPSGFAADRFSRPGTDSGA